MWQRIWQTFVINLIPSAHKRASWMKRHDVFKMVGDNVSLQFRKIPLYPKCIAFHNNIVVASNVFFITHDAVHLVFNQYLGKNRVRENVGCIEVMDNCFIGANSTILSNVRIGPNSIVAANSFVNKDIPAGEIWGGVPAHRIGTFDDLLKRRLEEKLGANQPKNQSICQEITDILWDRFHEIHNGQVKMEREITMENLKKYQEIFMDIFHVDADVLNESFTFQDQNDWDSLVHLTLISTLEDEFVIMFETDDILHFGGYENGIRILRKYGVDI